MWFGYFNNWIPQENFYYAAKNYNFEVNPLGRSEGTYNKYASLDDATDPLHYYMSYIKFGIGRATSDAAHEIRDGHITRDDGIKLCKKFEGEFPKRYIGECYDFMGISNEYAEKIIDNFRSPHLWNFDNNSWSLRSVVY